ncbi:MAG: beta-propeller domain-containing protein [Actinomycetota bacterium]
MRRALITAIAVAMFATACTSDGGSTDADEPDTTGGSTTTTGEVIELDAGDLRFVSSLRTFDECEALLDHIHTEAAERVGPFGLQGDGWYGPVFFEERDLAVEETAAAEDAESADGPFLAADGDDSGAESDGGLVEGEDFSGTNVQELGVDEADLVKTDGERILVLAGNRLIVVDPSTGTITDELEVAQGWSPEMFLAGDEVLLLSRGDITIAPASSSTDAESSFIETDEAYYGGSATIVQRISLAGEPRVLETLRVEGDYLTARSVGGLAQVVMRHDPQWQLPFVFPQSEAGEERAAEANRQIVRETTLDDWLPNYTVEVDGEIVAEGLLTSCDEVHAPTEFSGFGSSTVLTVPVGGEIDPSTSSTVLAPGEIVYASTGSVVVATTNWLDAAVAEDDWEQAWEDRRTNVHRFDTGGDRPTYTASGSVEGTIRDQFSLSEYDGHLRIVTTTGDPWGETSSSQVRVLRETDGELVEVGSVGDIGNGEDVQSVRFVGEIAYVVTFRQIDPFYTVDLSDPENPQVLGELKIPGFSSYLHPIGEGRVLGVGSDADEETGIVTGAKVSLFDVTDLTDPQEVAVWTAPDGWNDVGWEHRSFLWWEPEQIAVIPVQLWAENWAGAVVLQVQGGELVEIGRIDHTDDGEPEPGTTECDVLTAADLGIEDDTDFNFDSELEYLVADDYGLVLLCGEGEEPTAAGYSCYPEPYLSDEAARIGFEVPEGDALVTCWPGEQLQTIVRSLVIGDDLWTLSGPWGDLTQGGRLQSNAIVGLERGAVVGLS